MPAARSRIRPRSAWRHKIGASSRSDLALIRHSLAPTLGPKVIDLQAQLGDPGFKSRHLVQCHETKHESRNRDQNAETVHSVLPAPTQGPQLATKRQNWEKPLMVSRDEISLSLRASAPVDWYVSGGLVP